MKRCPRQTVVISTRYDVLGPPNGCDGPCEGTGLVPLRREGAEKLGAEWLRRWDEAEKKAPTDDGYHFVRCVKCQS